MTLGGVVHLLQLGVRRKPPPTYPYTDTVVRPLCTCACAWRGRAHARAASRSCGVTHQEQCAIIVHIDMSVAIFWCGGRVESLTD